MIIRQQIATSASWPKPEKICWMPSSPRRAGTEQMEASASPVITIRLVTGIGMRSRVKRTKATTVNAEDRDSVCVGDEFVHPWQVFTEKKKPACAGRLCIAGASLSCSLSSC